MWEWGFFYVISFNIDDCILYELYVWLFGDVVKVGVVFVMCSYN